MAPRAGSSPVHPELSGSPAPGEGGPRSRRTTRPALALCALLLGTNAYFVQAGGWNQNSRFDLVRAMKEVLSALLRHRRLELKLTDDVINTAVMAMIFQTLCDNKVSLVSVRSVGMQTEQAYLDMVEKEEQRGFTRLYAPAEAA